MVVHLESLQEGSQGAVAAAVGVDHRGADDLAVLHIIELELLGVAEMLENAAVFIGYCDSHGSFSFQMFQNGWFGGARAGLRAGIAGTEPVAAAADGQALAGDDGLGNFMPGGLVDLRGRGAGNVHPLRRLLMVLYRSSD